MPLHESLRQQAVVAALQMPTLLECWPTWQSVYRQLAGTTPTASSLVNTLGSSLAEVFRSTATGDRGQSSVSGGGYAWEALLCWYLNLCLIGTRAVVLKVRSHVPEPVRTSLRVTYGTTPTNSESDLVAITFPKDDALEAINGPYIYKPGKLNEIDKLVGSLFERLEVCVIQCKTNWKDNAQVPMLWDMIYSAKGFYRSDLEVGTAHRQVHDLSRFAYAFATVPTNRADSFKPEHMAAKRLSKLSGGTFWGYPGLSGVALPVGEIFTKNFKSAIRTLPNSWEKHHDGELLKLGSDYSYFNY